MTQLSSILSHLRSERDRLDKAIAALEEAEGKRGRRRGGISAAGRARIIAAQRKRWAKFRNKKH